MNLINVHDQTPQQTIKRTPLNPLHRRYLVSMVVYYSGVHLGGSWHGTTMQGHHALGVLDDIQISCFHGVHGVHGFRGIHGRIHQCINDAKTVLDEIADFNVGD